MKAMIVIGLIIGMCVPLVRGNGQTLNSGQFQAGNFKSENTAMMSSFLSTTAPLALSFIARGRGPTIAFAGLGLLAGPSIGYFYANKPLRGISGIGIRVGSVAMMAGGAGLGMSSGSEGGAGALILGGAALLVGDIIYDISKVTDAVGDYNRKLMNNSLNIAPIYFQNSRTTGVELTLKF